MCKAESVQSVFSGKKALAECLAVLVSFAPHMGLSCWPTKTHDIFHAVWMHLISRKVNRKDWHNTIMQKNSLGLCTGSKVVLLVRRLKKLSSE